MGNNSGGLLKVAVSGVVIIGLVTAFGLHSSGLASVGKTGFNGFNQVLGTAEKG
jgi:hypothetical protein